MVDVEIGCIADGDGAKEILAVGEKVERVDDGAVA